MQRLDVSPSVLVLVLAVLLLSGCGNTMPTYVSLDITCDGLGTVALEPDATTYACGTLVTLTPAPEAQWTFKEWDGLDKGDVVNDNGVWKITMDANKTLIARFVLTDDFNSYTSFPAGDWVDVGSDPTGVWDVLDNAGDKYVRCGKSYAQLIWGDPGLTDYSVTVRIRAGNASTSSYGIFARYQDGTHYYQLLLQVGSALQLNKQYGPTCYGLGQAAVIFNNMDYYLLKLEVNGTSIKGYVNDVKYIDYTDDDPSWGGPVTSGNAGIYSEINGYFDDFAVALMS